jgi:hypothetical protein
VGGVGVGGGGGVRSVGGVKGVGGGVGGVSVTERLNGRALSDTYIAYPLRPFSDSVFGNSTPLNSMPMPPIPMPVLMPMPFSALDHPFHAYDRDRDTDTEHTEHRAPRLNADALVFSAALSLFRRQQG